MHGRQAVGECYAGRTGVLVVASYATNAGSRCEPIDDDDAVCHAAFDSRGVEGFATEHAGVSHPHDVAHVDIAVDDAQVRNGAIELGEESVARVVVGLFVVDIESVDDFPVTVELGFPFARCPFVSSFARCLIVLQQVVVHEQVVGEFEVDARPVVLGVIHRALQFSDAVNPVGLGYRAVAGAEEAGA